MRQPNVPADHPDNSCFDTRVFSPSREEINTVCRFFRIGFPKIPAPRLNIPVSHSNFIIPVRTGKGVFILKFHVNGQKEALLKELAISRFLSKKRVRTPSLIIGIDGNPFTRLNGYWTTCHRFIPGTPLYQNTITPGIVRQTVSSLQQLRRALADIENPQVLMKTMPFPRTLSTLLRQVRKLSPFPKEAVILRTIQNAHGTFHSHTIFFQPAPVHTNITLGNLILHHKRVAVLDLGHIRQDMPAADLVSLMVSCFLLKRKKEELHALWTNGAGLMPCPKVPLTVLSAIVRTELVKEYLNTLKWLSIVKERTPLAADYRKALRARACHLISALTEKKTGVIY